MINLQLKLKVEHKLKELAEFILAFDYKEIPPVDYYGGMSGMLPFLFDYSAYAKDSRYSDQGENYIHHIVGAIDGGDVPHVRAGGISGFAWVLEWLAENAYIERLDLMYPFDDRLCELMIKEMRQGNWDPLHGSVGMSFYLFKRLENPNVKKTLEVMLEHFESTAEKTGTGIKWSMYDITQDKQVYNFGLAHGMPSIMLFFAKCIERNIYRNKSKVLLKSLIQYLLSKKNLDSSKEYIFKGKENGHDTGPRMAWCYGDLGVTVAFQYVNEIIGGLDEEISALLDSLIIRKDPARSLIRDVGFCHGSLGAAHIYNYMRQKGHKKVKVEEVEYWIEHSLSLANYEDGFVGYKSYWPTHEQPEIDRWAPQVGLLTGITGIASIYLSFLNGNLKWSEGLMLF